MEKVKVTSEYLRAYFGHGIDYGYTAAPNLLLVHGKSIGLDDITIMFIIQILRAVYQSKTGIISDEDLNMSITRNTYTRIRKALTSLKDKKGSPLVTASALYRQDEESGKIKGYGTSYDFKAFFEYLTELEEKPTGKKKKGKPAAPEASPTPKICQEKKGKTDSQKMTGKPQKKGQKTADCQKLTGTNKNCEYSYTELAEGELRCAKYGKIPKLLLRDGAWSYYSDGTVQYETEPEFYPWSRVSTPSRKALAMMDAYNAV